MKNTKGQNGITLIALVVTIVVLLILAGVTITYVLSEGGIFSTANKAVSDTEIAIVKDYASGGVIACIGVYYNPDIADDRKATEAGTAMQNSFPAGAVSAAPTVTLTDGSVSSTFEATVSGKKYNVKITNSKVEVTANTAS